ncbi:MAG: transglycosylase domain-containing protein, partial [Actinomycetota bacterium]
GSAFKPFTAVAALESGLAPSQRLVGNGPIKLDYGRPEKWEVDNFEGSDMGRVDLPTALRKSVNTAFAQIGVAAGAEAITGVVKRVGIDVDAALGDGSQRGPSIALGGVAHGVSALEMATAYSVFANGGNAVEPYLIERVLDADGEVLYEREPRPEPVIDPAIAGTVRWMLQEAVARGTGTAARIDGLTPMGKTGTSQDAADAWFVGSIPTLTAAVWVGDPDARVPMSNATGGTVAAPIWHTIVAGVAAHEEQPPFPQVPDLPPAEGLELPDAERCRRSCRSSD